MTSLQLMLSHYVNNGRRCRNFEILFLRLRQASKLNHQKISATNSTVLVSYSTIDDTLLVAGTSSYTAAL